MSLQLGKAVRQVVEKVGEPPNCPLKFEPYVSHNFMALFVTEEHAEYFKKIAIQYVKQVSSVCKYWHYFWSWFPLFNS